MAFRLPKKRLIAAFAAVAFVVVPSAIASGATLTLEASKDELRPGKSSTLSGALSGTLTGNSGRTVTLLADPFPYGSEQSAGTTATDGSGAFSFQVTPELNTRYRVTFDGGIPDGSAASETVPVYVYVQDVRVELFNTSRPFQVAGTFDITYSPQVQPEFFVGNRVYWYFRKSSQNFFKRIEKSRFQDSFEGVHAEVKIELPRSRKGYRYSIAACSSVPNEDIGTGPPDAFKCGKRLRAGRTARSTLSPVVAFRGLYAE